MVGFIRRCPSDGSIHHIENINDPPASVQNPHSEPSMSNSPPTPAPSSGSTSLPPLHLLPTVSDLCLTSRVPRRPRVRYLNLAGFMCHLGDREYAQAARTTGTRHNAPVYWFMERGRTMEAQPEAAPVEMELAEAAPAATASNFIGKGLLHRRPPRARAPSIFGGDAGPSAPAAVQQPSAAPSPSSSAPDPASRVPAWNPDTAEQFGPPPFQATIPFCTVSYTSDLDDRVPLWKQWNDRHPCPPRVVVPAPAPAASEPEVRTTRSRPSASTPAAPPRARAPRAQFPAPAPASRISLANRPAATATATTWAPTPSPFAMAESDFPPLMGASSSSEDGAKKIDAASKDKENGLAGPWGRKK